MSKNRKPRSVYPSKDGVRRLEQAKAQGRDDECKPLTFERIAAKAQVSDKTVKRFFCGKGVDPYSADGIIRALGLKQEDILSSEELLVAESIEKIEASSTALEEPGTNSERPAQLIGELERILRDLKKSTDDSYQAMDWLKANRKNLAQEAAEAALKEHLNQKPLNENQDYAENVELLSKDIKKYLQLLYHCLEEGAWKLLDQAMQKSLIPLNIELSYYVKALIFIKNERVAKELSPEAAKELTLCLDYLVKIIPIIF